MNSSMTISPADPEFDRIADTLGQFLDDLDQRNRAIVYKTEASFREFCAFAIQSIAVD